MLRTLSTGAGSERMPTVTFSLEDAFYRALEEIGKKVSASPHRVAKEIVVNHLLNLMFDTYVLHKAGNLMQNINMEHKYPDIYVPHKYQDIYAEHKAQTYSSDINIAHKVQNADSGSGDLVQSSDTDIANDVKDLVKKVEALERSVAELRDAITTLTKEIKESSRKQQDLLNAYTGKNDIVLQRLSQLIEAIERLVVSGSGAKEGEKQAEKRRYVERGRQKEDMSKSAKARKGKRDACSILKEQLVVLESEVADKIRNRDVFFASLERCSVRIDTARERIAVESGFWEKFVEKLGRVNTNDEEKIAQVLDPLELKLFKTLKESALIAFDAMKKAWILVEKPKTPKVQAQVEPQDDESWLLQYVDLDSSAEAEATNTND